MAAVLTEVRDGVLVITLNRPEARNAVNGDVVAGMEAALDRLEAEDDLYLAIICGNGPVFCAGADLKMLAADGAFQPIVTKRGGFGGLTFASTTNRSSPRWKGRRWPVDLSLCSRVTWLSRRRRPRSACPR